MKLSEQQLNTFIKLYEEKYGVFLDAQEASDKAVRLLKIIQLVESNNMTTQGV